MIRPSRGECQGRAPIAPRRKTCYNKRTNKEGDGDGKQEIRQALDPRTFEKPGMDQGTYGTASSPSPIPPFQRSLRPPLAPGRCPGRRGHRGLSGQIQGGPAPGAPTCRPPRAAAQAAAALLGRAWQDAPREETWPWVLAGYYHQAIVSHLPAAARGRGLRSNQISGFLNQFLSLGTRCDEAQLPGVLTHFVQAGVWLGDHPDAPLAGLVKAQYPGVLRAAAEQVIVSFTAAQPEAICGAAADEGLSRLSAALPNLGLSLLRLLCSPSHPHQLRGPHGPEPQGRVP